MATSISDVRQAGARQISVTFSGPVFAFNSALSFDATRIENYKVYGVDTYVVTGVVAVDDTSNEVEISVDVPFVAGAHRVVCAGIVGTDGSAVVDEASFNTVVMPVNHRATGGTITGSVTATLKKFLGEGIRGTNTNAILAALATAEKTLRDNASLAFDQLFKVSANTPYLDRKSADDGVFRPEAFGMSDELFRKYSIAMSADKLNASSLLKVLEVLYGSDAVRAHIDTDNDTSFVFTAGMTLDLLLDGKDALTVLFSDADFADLAQATPTEAAVAITRAIRSNGLDGYAISIDDPYTGVERVRIYSGALGLSSSIAITGGSAQNALSFPTEITDVIVTSWAAPTWKISIPSVGTARFELLTAAGFDFNLLRIGDYVNFNVATASAANRGCHKVTNVYYAISGGSPVQYFDAAVDGAVVNATAVQATQGEVHYFRQHTATPYNQSGYAVSVTNIGDGLQVVLPATSAAVVRGELNAAHLQSFVELPLETASYSVASGTRTTANATLTIGTHTFVADDYVKVVSNDANYPSGLYKLLSVGASTVTYYDNANNVVAFGGVATAAHVPILRNGLNSTRVRTVAAHGLIAGDQFEITGASTDGSSIVTGAQAKLSTSGNPGASLASPVTAVSPMRTSDISWRIDFICERAANGDIIVFGGSDDGTGMTSHKDGARLTSSSTTDADGVTTVSYNWTPISNFVFEMFQHQSCVLNDGRIFMCGGKDNVDIAMAGCAIYNPVTDGWLASGLMSSARIAHTATTLADGKVIAIAGNDGAVALDTADIYDPATSLWTPANNTLGTLVWHKSILLNNGKVLVTGGFRNSGVVITSTCQLYDPAMDVFSFTGSMHTARAGHTLTKLSDGRVIVAGGGSNVVEVYDPMTEKWEILATMIEARNDFLPGLIEMWPISGTSHGHSLFVTGAMASFIDYMNLSAGSKRVPIPIGRHVFSRDGVFTFDFGSYAVTIGGSGDDGLGNIGVYLGGELLVYNGAPTNAMGRLNGFGGVSNVVHSKAFNATIKNGTSGFAMSSGGSLIKSVAAAGVTAGPFAFDPNGKAISSIEGTAVAPFAKGSGYSVVVLGSNEASAFPDAPGWLVFGFGEKYETGPVRYFGVQSSDTLRLDASFKFPTAIPAGANVTYLTQRTGYLPEGAGSFWATASSAGRVVAQDAVERITGAGVGVTETIVYPSDRGVGGEGSPVSGQSKLSDKVAVWGGDDLDGEIVEART